MTWHFAPEECSALTRLVASSETDAVFRTDRRGTIVRASPAAAWFGLAFPGDPVGRHLLELVHPDCAAEIAERLQAALFGTDDGRWTEVLVLAQNGRQRWVEMRLRRLDQEPGKADGTLGIVRSIDERRSLEDRLFVAAMTDPLTRLSNRSAFTRMLRHLVEERIGGCLALFDIDHFRTINMRYGHSGGDKVLVAFAGLMRGLLGERDIVSRIDGETFGVLLPRTALDEAAEACRGVIAALDALERGEARITASAGLATIRDTFDGTLRRAELALIAAKAHGRNRLELEAPTSRGH